MIIIDRRGKVVKGLGSVVKHLSFDTGIASSITCSQNKSNYVRDIPRKNVPVNHCYTLGTLTNLVCRGGKYEPPTHKKLANCMSRRRMGMSHCVNK